ncbi:MAG: hypothetical protein HY517_03165 [Candidatus Aenigmarchaeota archaeon]|nr:hypothetical protein [Candidatus Aenigmarchaeota archaeon]
MRCTICADIFITLNEEDRRDLEADRFIEADVQTYAGEKKLRLYLEDHIERRSSIEKRGFMVDFEPPDSDIESRTAYLVRIDRAALANLISCGYATSRWGAGLRLDFNYYRPINSAPIQGR